MAQKHLVIPETCQCQMVFAVAGRNTSVVFHYKIPAGTPVNVTLSDAVFTALKSRWNSNLAALCSSSTTFTGVNLRDLRDQGFPLVPSTGASAAGTAPTTDTLPRQIAACLTVRTGKAGRKFRGRMYMPGFAEVANDVNNHMTAAAKTALDSFAANFLSSANVSGLAMGVAHRPTIFDENTGLPIDPGRGFIEVATAVVCRNDVWDNQRRRAG